MGRDGMEKVLHYLEDNLPATFSHPLKTMEDCDILSFLCGVLQVYVMPARIAGGHLLLGHTEETASSEAAGQHRIRQRKLSSKPNGGGSTQAINSKSRPN